MGVLIVGGVVALAVLLAGRMGGGGQGNMVSPLALGQPAGSRIGGVAAAEGRLAVWVVRPDGDRVLLVDPRTNRLVGEMRLGEGVPF